LITGDKMEVAVITDADRRSGVITAEFHHDFMRRAFVTVDIATAATVMTKVQWERKLRVAFQASRAIAIGYSAGLNIKSCVQQHTVSDEGKDYLHLCSMYKLIVELHYNECVKRLTYLNFVAQGLKESMTEVSFSKFPTR
jgi:hypothetical protein